eukprot:TRINITY_DN28050_c0_g3_i4.p1 TRINITY_DN28050_c0_g3~~TRINITY_DN28050_c0_g3_i4.p1  ORF type:complete len:726 (+),score=140.06 TRINITY_DN28050_c0_g3_i4:64-2241(+)
MDASRHAWLAKPLENVVASPMISQQRTSPARWWGIPGEAEQRRRSVEWTGMASVLRRAALCVSLGLLGILGLSACPAFPLHSQSRVLEGFRRQLAAISAEGHRRLAAKSPPPPRVAVVHSADNDIANTDYDCRKGLYWDGSWSAEKLTWCCKSEHIGCGELDATADNSSSQRKDTSGYDCHSDIQLFEILWSGSKKRWCCEHKQIGCPKLVHAAGENCLKPCGSPGLCAYCGTGVCCHAGDKHDPVECGGQGGRLHHECIEETAKSESQEAKTLTPEAARQPEALDAGLEALLSSESQESDHDCNLGVEFWNSAWSASKATYCCKMLGMGCDRLSHTSEDCWEPCQQKAGYCAYCGSGACCRNGFEPSPAECRDAEYKDSSYHICVQVEKAVLAEVYLPVEIDGAPVLREIEGETGAYIVDNMNLRSTSIGMPYRIKKDIGAATDPDVFAAWGSKVYGRRDYDGWLELVLPLSPLTRDNLIETAKSTTLPPWMEHARAAAAGHQSAGSITLQMPPMPSLSAPSVSDMMPLVTKLLVVFACVGVLAGLASLVRGASGSEKDGSKEEGPRTEANSIRALFAGKKLPLSEQKAAPPTEGQLAKQSIGFIVNSTELTPEGAAAVRALAAAFADHPPMFITLEGHVEGDCKDPRKCRCAELSLLRAQTVREALQKAGCQHYVTIEGIGCAACAAAGMSPKAGFFYEDDHDAESVGLLSARGLKEGNGFGT